MLRKISIWYIDKIRNGILDDIEKLEHCIEYENHSEEVVVSMLESIKTYEIINEKLKAVSDYLKFGIVKVN